MLEVVGRLCPPYIDEAWPHSPRIFVLLPFTDQASRLQVIVVERRQPPARTIPTTRAQKLVIEEIGVQTAGYRCFSLKNAHHRARESCDCCYILLRSDTAPFESALLMTIVHNTSHGGVVKKQNVEA